MHQSINPFLKEHNIPFESYTHEPILDYTTANKVRNMLGYTGTESKSLFLKSKAGNYYVYITLENSKLDSKLIKKITGEKVSIYPSDKLTELTGCTPGCVAPFGYIDSVSLVIDSRIYECEKFIFSPGISTETIILTHDNLIKLINLLPNKIFEVNLS